MLSDSKRICLKLILARDDQGRTTMKWENASLQTRLYIICAGLLLTGLGSSIFIYVTADNEENSAPSYEVVGGQVYPGMHEQSKKYIHDLEVYGGKAAVLADQFNRWFYSLWHGQNLAFTIAGLTVFLCMIVFIVARNTTSESSGSPRKENKMQKPSD
jgi:hypothetical protein